MELTYIEERKVVVFASQAIPYLSTLKKKTVDSMHQQMDIDY